MRKYDYWSHVAGQGGVEAAEANPDILAEPEEQDEDSIRRQKEWQEKKQDALKKLLEAGMEKLTPRQREILVLCGAKGFSTEDVSKKLGVSQQYVSKVFIQIKEKIGCISPKKGV